MSQQSRQSSRAATPPAIAVAIGSGGALGSCARYALGRSIPTAHQGFPWSTYLINTAGSFALALLVISLVEVWRPTRYQHPFWVVGFIGSFTTFSTAVVETDLLFAHNFGVGVVYLLVSVLSGFFAAGLGLVLGRTLAATAGTPR